MQVEVVIGDIARQADMEAVVNSANSNLRMGTGVAGAIHTAAGPELEDYCEALAPLDLGKAVITPGFNLPNRWVIHTVAVSFLNHPNPEQVLAKAIDAAVRVANEHGSVAVFACSGVRGSRGSSCSRTEDFMKTWKSELDTTFYVALRF